MKYKDYSATDFANDSFFIRWIKKPDQESDWFWISFIDENPDCKPAIEEARELISSLDFPLHDLPDEELHSMRHGLLMALQADIEEHRDNKSMHSRRFTIPVGPWLKLAAVLIIIPLITSGIVFFMNTGDSTISALKRENAKEVETRVNPVGQKSVLFLSDGTKVWLNAASKISYVKDFMEQKTRDVYLEGEAFFDVAHDARKPFIVHTSSIKIKVLGTSFNVKSYHDEKTIETTLVRGKVRIEQLDESGNRVSDVELKPNQYAVFNKESKIINIKEVVADNSGSWRQERLVFDGESIDNVILQMERWYNIKIHVDNKGSLDCKLTASIEKESLEEVLKLLQAASHDIQYTIAGRDVFIKGVLCKK